MKALDAYYPLIGKVVVRFQDLDMVVNITMACLLGEDPNVTQAFMVTLPFSKKLDVLRSVAPFKFKRQDLIDRLDRVLPVLSQAEDGRNRVVHATWIGSSASDTVYFHKPRATRKAGLKDGGIRHATIAELEQVIKSIASAMKEFCELGSALEKAKVLSTKMFLPYSADRIQLEMR